MKYKINSLLGCLDVKKMKLICIENLITHDLIAYFLYSKKSNNV